MEYCSWKRSSYATEECVSNEINTIDIMSVVADTETMCCNVLIFTISFANEMLKCRSAIGLFRKHAFDAFVRFFFSSSYFTCFTQRTKRRKSLLQISYHPEHFFHNRSQQLNEEKKKYVFSKCLHSFNRFSLPYFIFRCTLSVCVCFVRTIITTNRIANVFLQHKKQANKRKFDFF